MEEKQLTILVPALNEEKTISICLEKAKKVIKENNLNAEILVIDNASTDSTSEIAKSYNVRVEFEKERGYGNALRTGINKAKGKFTIMVDADDSYNLLEIYPLYQKLLEGYDLVIGNRYKGKMEKKSMKFSHKYIGTPLISFFARKKYKMDGIGDFNCGLRAFDTEKIKKLNCISSGMEFATEMLIKAQKSGIKMTEIPINFYKDKRHGSSHLRTIRDGIRHLKIICKG